MNIALLGAAFALALSGQTPAPEAPSRIDKTTARALGELITVSVARHQTFDVLSSSDLRRVVELEAEKQAVGCSEEASCLAEIAGAMGARYVVFGQISPVGDRIILTLNLFDSELGSSSGRVVLMGARVDELFGQIDAKVDELVARAVQNEAPASGDRAAAPERVKVLVLDLEAPEPKPEPDVIANNTTIVEGWQPDAGFWLLLGGAGVGTAGVAAGATGAVFGLLASNAHDSALASTFQDDRASSLQQRDSNALIANVLYASTGVLVLAAAGVTTASFFFGGEEP